MALNPAHKIITKLGGEKAVAEQLGLSESVVYRWAYPRDRRGTGGLIPARHIKPLIEIARARGKRLTLQDFFQDPSEA